MEAYSTAATHFRSFPRARTFRQQLIAALSLAPIYSVVYEARQL
jgi:hypothetical protein